jgi:hypothetical protein
MLIKRTIGRPENAFRSGGRVAFRETPSHRAHVARATLLSFGFDESFMLPNPHIKRRNLSWMRVTSRLANGNLFSESGKLLLESGNLFLENGNLFLEVEPYSFGGTNRTAKLAPPDESTLAFTDIEWPKEHPAWSRPGEGLCLVRKASRGFQLLRHTP